jgi:hypothetical protein
MRTEEYNLVRIKLRRDNARDRAYSAHWDSLADVDGGHVDWSWVSRWLALHNDKLYLILSV